MTIVYSISQLQINEYETAPYFFYKTKTWHRIFPWIYLRWTWNCSEQQKRTILGSAQVNSGKTRGKHRNDQTISCQVLASWFQIFDNSIKNTVKFGYSEKATKFEKNLPLKIWRHWVEDFFKFCGLHRISKLYLTHLNLVADFFFKIIFFNSNIWYSSLQFS